MLLYITRTSGEVKACPIVCMPTTSCVPTPREVFSKADYKFITVSFFNFLMTVNCRLFLLV